LMEGFTGGPVATVGYLVADRRGGSAVVFDAPQGTAAALVARAKEWATPIQYLITTHGHWDHVLDNAALVRLTGAKLGIHRDSEPLLTYPQLKMFGLEGAIEPSRPDFYLAGGRELVVGELRFQILECPGHCPGSVALYEAREQVVFVGDVLFAGAIGRTDFPGGDYDQLMESIHQKLLPLDDAVRVLPGHGPATTIGQERRTNPFLA